MPDTPGPAADYTRIPELYRKLPRWLMYRNEKGPTGLPTKVPYQVSGVKAQANNPGTWVRFDVAVKALATGKFSGIGFARADDFVFVDLDGCLDEAGNYIRFPELPDELQPEAIVSELEPYAYIERSPSGRGLHIVVRALSLPTSVQINLPGEHRGVAIYAASRYFTFSGQDLWTGDVSSDASHVLGRLARRMAEVRTEMAAAKSAALLNVHANGHGDAKVNAKVSENERKSAKKAKKAHDPLARAREKDDFRDWEAGSPTGLSDPSPSGIDLAICQRLAFWTAGNASEMDSLFRQTAWFSNAKREAKWDSARPGGTYGSNTIDFAISHQSSFYDPESRLGHSPENPSKTQQKRVSQLGHSSDPIGTLPPEPPFYTWTDTGNAKRFRDAYREIARYTSGEKGWRWYENGAWLFDPGSRIALEKAIQIVEAMLQEGFDTKNEKQSKWALRSLQSGALESMIKLASALPPIHMPATDFDARDGLLPARNGVIDLGTSELLPHKPEYYFTGTLAVDYDPAARSQVWDDYLAAVQPDPEARDFLQLAAGYTLGGSTREECCFFLTGSGRNGKGAFLLALQNLLGSFATTANFHTFLYSRRDNTVDLASFRGKRMVVAQEAGLHATFNEGQLKTMTGGDKISAKMLYQNPIEFVPNCKIWFASNTLPEVQDDSPGFWSRMIVIPFPVSFAGREDFGLKQSLLEPDVQRGILAWTVEGHLRLKELGRLPRPPMVEKATAEYREDSDPIARFLVERCEADPANDLAAREIYTQYDIWCRGINLRPYAETQFSKKLKALGYQKRVLAGRRFWVGIRLTDR